MGYSRNEFELTFPDLEVVAPTGANSINLILTISDV